MKKSLLLFCFIFVVDFVFLSYSQSVTDLPYFESFEDSASYAEWKLNVGSIASHQKACNQWYISDSEHFMGNKSLLISSDVIDTSAVYSASIISMMVSYRDFELPRTLGASASYDLSFAWRCVGESDEGGSVCNDGLYVLWIPATQVVNSAMLFDAKYEKMALEFEVYGNKHKFLNSSFEWQIANTKVTAARGECMRLVFIWRSNSNTITEAPSICIDNIQLSLAKEDCLRPSDLTMTELNSNVMRLSWQGNCDEYDLMYHAYGDTTTFIASVKDNHYDLVDLPDGLYSFYVRGICYNDVDLTANDTTIWSVLSEYLVYSKDDLCIDISNFNSSGTECYYGLHSSDWITDAKQGVVDYGPQSIESRHTVHYQPYEFDVRTGNGLKTVPDGNVVSVRLGNWDRKGNAESVVYTIDIPEDVDMMLLMKYAIVFENPYCKNVQRFQLDILDEKGKLVDPDCGHVEFYADSSSYEWNKYVYTEYYSNKDEDGNIVNRSHDVEVLWKDWTTIGVNLRDYAGEQIKIRLTVMDCLLRDVISEVGHYGYMYFTLECASASIEGISCGEHPTTSVSAPIGFDYEWYNVEEPDNIICRDREMPIEPTDASVYECRCMFMEDHNCFFTLEANLAPRYPVAQFIPQWVPDSCKNKMRFENTSVVKVGDGVTGDKIEDYYWDFGNNVTSTDPSPVLDFPDEGAIVTGRLTVSIAGGLCSDTYEFECIVPTIKLGNDTLKKTICKGESYRFAGGIYRTSGEYVSPTYRNVAGCDSFAVLQLTVVDKVEAEIYDTIFEGETYNLNGIEYKKSGIYFSTIPSSAGCDSLITLHLTVLQTIKVEFEDQPEVCEGDSVFSIYFNVLQGQYDSYSLKFDTIAIAAGFEDETNVVLNEDRFDVKVPIRIKPNRYTVTVIFNDSSTTNVEMPFSFDIYYSSDIMEQKFDNLIALKNTDNNGGYEFENESYQWYKNGNILAGETDAYYYGEEEKFEEGDCFYFEATREDDGIRMRSCEFCYSVGVDVDNVLDDKEYNFVTILSSSEVIYLENVGDCRAYLYTFSGKLLYSDVFSENQDIFFKVPNISGMYILQLQTKDDNFIVKIMVK